MVDQPGQQSKIVVDLVRDSTMDLSEVCDLGREMGIGLEGARDGNS